MNADNWGICPRCHKKWNGPKSQYGKVSEEAYLELIKIKPAEEPQTMREDYEIGTDEDGLFTIHYSCSCSKCGFSQDYQFDKQWKVTP